MQLANFNAFRFVPKVKDMGVIGRVPRLLYPHDAKAYAVLLSPWEHSLSPAIAANSIIVVSPDFQGPMEHVAVWHFETPVGRPTEVQFALGFVQQRHKDGGMVLGYTDDCSTFGRHATRSREFRPGQVIAVQHIVASYRLHFCDGRGVQEGIREVFGPVEDPTAMPLIACGAVVREWKAAAV